MPHSKIHDLRWTGTVTKEADVLGHRATFDVKDYVSDALNPSHLYATKCEAVFVLNKSSGTLAKGRRVLPSTTASYYPPVAVAGLGGAEVPFAGVVSPFIAGATVADGAGFWLIVKGLTYMGYDGSANFAIGDDLATAANGTIAEWSDYTDIFVGYSAAAKTSGSAGDLHLSYLCCNTCY